MAYIKVAKADAKFDIVSCENIGDCKLDTSGTGTDITIKYLSGYKVTINAGTDDFVQADVDLVLDAIQKYAGTSGPAPLVSLSKVVTATDMAAV